VVPDVATSVDPPDDRTSVVRLRHDVRFHSGRELTSADVVFTFGSFLDQTFTSGRKGSYRLLQAVEAIDPYISLWHKTNVVVTRPNVVPGPLSPLADLGFLRHTVKR